MLKLALPGLNKVGPTLPSYLDVGNSIYFFLYNICTEDCILFSMKLLYLEEMLKPRANVINNFL